MKRASALVPLHKLRESIALRLAERRLFQALLRIESAEGLDAHLKAGKNLNTLLTRDARARELYKLELQLDLQLRKLGAQGFFATPEDKQPASGPHGEPRAA